MISYAVNESSAILRIVLSLQACTMVAMARDHDVGIPGMCIYSLCQSQHAWPRQPDRLSKTQHATQIQVVESETVLRKKYAP